MNNKVEVWKIYPEIEWLQGSNLGSVRTLDHYVDGRWGKTLIKGHVLKQGRMKNGYMIVGLSVNGKKVYPLVHRIIASCFLPNPDNLPEVNHKDCNPKNNCINNLEWCTHQENIAYRDKLGHIARHNKPKKPVIAVNLKTLTVLYFKSQHEAARKLGASQGNINSVLKSKRNKCSGYWFTNADDGVVENVRAKFGSEVANKVSALADKKEN